MARADAGGDRTTARRGERRSRPSPPAKTGLGEARPVGLLALGSPYSPRLPSRTGQWLSRVSSPNTVTGSRRILTAFPVAPLGSTGAKRRHLSRRHRAAQRGDGRTAAPA